MSQRRKRAHQGLRLLPVREALPIRAFFKGRLVCLWAWVFTTDSRRRQASLGRGILPRPLLLCSQPDDCSGAGPAPRPSQSKQQRKAFLDSEGGVDVFAQMKAQ